MNTGRSVVAIIAISLCILGLTISDSFSEVRYKSSIGTYTVPNITLVNQDGMKVDFKDYLKTKSDRPVLLQFVFTTCTTICPILSAGFSSLQKELGAESEKVQLVSISIDPENDTPPVMKEYLKRYHRKPGWDFLTGRVEDIALAMKNFNALVENRMTHQPLTYLRPARSDKWVRIEGLMSGQELRAEYAKLDK